MKSPFRTLPPVGKSRDLTRIMEIPRREQPSAEDLDAMAAKWTEKLRRPGHESCDCRIKKLLPQQGWALEEVGPADGLIALMGVGSGKTIVWILLPFAITNCKRAGLLLPPGLVEQFVLDYEEVRKHFHVPDLLVNGALYTSNVEDFDVPAIIIIPYSKLQMPESSTMLKEYNLDIIMADEMHSIKRLESARTRRVAAALASKPGMRFAGGTGSAITDTIRDLGHLAAFALGDSSPLPHKESTLMEWSTATDPLPCRAGAGRLLDLGGTDARDAVRQRIYSTLGVVTSPSRGGAVASMVMKDLSPNIPQPIAKMMNDVRETWTRPDGEEFIQLVEVRECLIQLGCGFYQRWVFPPSTSQSHIDMWKEARRDWHRELRQRLARPMDGMDSPELCRRAAVRYWDGYEGDFPVWDSQCWQRWAEVKDTLPHTVEVVWVDDFLASLAAEEALSSPQIIWYRHKAIGERVSALTSLPLHVGTPKTLRAEKGKRSVILSSNSYGQGWNGLQYLFDTQYVLEPPSSWEQLLGRLNRVGQPSDEVVTKVARHTRELRDVVDRAFEEAKFAADLGGPQLMLAADIEWGLHFKK